MLSVRYVNTCEAFSSSHVKDDPRPRCKVHRKLAKALIAPTLGARFGQLGGDRALKFGAFSGLEGNHGTCQDFPSAAASDDSVTFLPSRLPDSLHECFIYTPHSSHISLSQQARGLLILGTWFRHLRGPQQSAHFIDRARFLPGTKATKRATADSLPTLLPQ